MAKDNTCLILLYSKCLGKENPSASRCSFILGQIRAIPNLIIECREIYKYSNYCQWSWAVRLVSQSPLFSDLSPTESEKHIGRSSRSAVALPDNYPDSTTPLSSHVERRGCSWEQHIKSYHRLLHQHCPHAHTTGKEGCPVERSLDSLYGNLSLVTAP